MDQLACGFADAGLHVTVICPLSLTRALMHRKRLPPARLVKTTPGGHTLSVLRPRTLSVSDGKTLGIDRTMLTQRLFERAALRALNTLPERPDALYGHFIALSGLCAAQLGQSLGIPAFLGYGESAPLRYARYDHGYLKSTLSKLSGIASVSSENERELRRQGLVMDSMPVGVFPNAVDRTRFRPMDKALAREKLGYDQRALIVGFVGAFTERKGVMVLSRALDRLEGVQSIFIGKGELRPACRGALHVGPLPHERVPEQLAACDMFTLPTLAEGCCNAIVEALSMGLPVVSSALPFNDDILSERNALLIDPTSVDQLAGAIARLRDEPELRARLSEGALETARELEIGARVQRMLAFFEACIP